MQAIGSIFDSYGRDLVSVGAIASLPTGSGEAYWSLFLDEEFESPHADGIETDYTLNKKTGEVKLHGEINNDPDRIVEVKKNGDVKVEIDNIAKGILENGMNLKNDDSIIKVNGKNSDGTNQPTTEDVEYFVYEISSYVSKEIGGTYISNNLNSVRDSHIAIGRYKDNFFDNVKSFGMQRVVKEGFIGKNIKGFFYTHPKGVRNPSPRDINTRDAGLRFNPQLRYNIITNTRYGEVGKIHRTPY